eukprot:356945-Lingulodinium_polyedra.AAC.1
MMQFVEKSFLWRVQCLREFVDKGMLRYLWRTDVSNIGLDGVTNGVVPGELLHFAIAGRVDVRVDSFVTLSM